MRRKRLSLQLVTLVLSLLFAPASLTFAAGICWNAFENPVDPKLLSRYQDSLEPYAQGRFVPHAEDALRVIRYLEQNGVSYNGYGWNQTEIGHARLTIDVNRGRETRRARQLLEKLDGRIETIVVVRPVKGRAQAN